MNTERNHPFQFPLSKQLILDKINLEEHKDKKKYIEQIFTDPNLYFTDEFNGHSVVIGKKNSKNVIVRKQPTNRKSIFKMAQRLSQSRVDKTDNSIKKNNLVKVMSNQSNRRIIEHDELSGIYKRFKEINLENSEERSNFKKKNKKLFIDKELTEDIDNKENKTLKTEIEHELQFQEEVLNKKKIEDSKKEKITKNISQKIKRPISKLLITQNEEYRTKKEIQDSYFKEVQHSFPDPIYKWFVTLRDTDIHYLNDGSEKRPIWNFYINKKEVKETIRNPEMFYKTDFGFYKKNNYLKTKIPYKTFYSITREMNDTMTDFKKMCVKGRNLLDVEIENSKYLKGRKIVMNGNPFANSNALVNFNIQNDKNTKEEMYKNNIDPKFIKKKIRAVSSLG